MSYVAIDTMEAAKQDLQDFIRDNFEFLDQIIAKAPTSYNLRSSGHEESIAWGIGFHRCLAELKRVAAQVKVNQEEGDITK